MTDLRFCTQIAVALGMNPEKLHLYLDAILGSSDEQLRAMVEFVLESGYKLVKSQPEKSD